MKLGVASVAKSFTIDMWLARHTPAKVLPILRSVVSSSQEEFADAVANGGGMYGVGYCFGAKYILLLSAAGGGEQDPDTQSSQSQAEEGHARSPKPVLKCAAIAHGTDITTSDLSSVRVPLCIVAVKEDPLFPDHIRKQGHEALKENGVKVDLEVYEGVPHGFAVVGEYPGMEGVGERQKEAFDKMTGWLRAH